MNDLLSYAFRDKRGNLIYSQSPGLPMVPASNMKIVTGFISSILLGDDFEILTVFRVSGDILIISGGPCPLLRTPEAESLGKQLEDFKIKRVLFNRGFDEDVYAPGWHPEDQGECYQTRVTSFSLNENCVPKMRNNLQNKIVEPHSRETIPDIRPYDTLSKKLVPELSDDVFPSFEFTNSTKGRLVYTHKEMLGDVLQHLETLSCNFSADSLFKYIHHFKTGEPGSWRGGSKTVTNEIEKLNLQEPGIRIVDGSGLSPFNRLTPSFLSKFIIRASEFEGGKFLEHLASPGVGTMEKRLMEFKEYGLKAKTGSLAGVATLSGYIKKLDIAFSIMLNDFDKKSKEARKVIDETLTDFIHKVET